MDLSDYATTALAYMTIDNEAFQRNKIYVVDYVDIVNVIDNLYSIGEKRIKKDMVQFKLKEQGISLPNSLLNVIYRKVKDFDEGKLAKEDFYSAVNLVKEHVRKSEVLEKLQMAMDMIANGNEKDGIAIAKSIRFQNSKTFRSTEDLMRAAIDETNGFKTGVNSIDDNGGFLLGNVIGLAGASGSMKTRASLWLILEILRNNPTFKAYYFEKEMPVKDIVRLPLSNVTNTAVSDIMRISFSGAGEDKKDELRYNLERALEKRDDPFLEVLSRITFIPNTDFDNALDIMEIVDSHRPSIWAVDFVTMLGRNKGANTFEFIVNQMEILKETAGMTDSWGCLLSQLKKGTVNNRQNVVKVPEIDDMEYGNKLEQLASDVYTTFFPAMYYSQLSFESGTYPMDKKYFYLVGRKHRNGSPGNIVPLSAHPNSNRYFEMEDEDARKSKEWLHYYMHGRPSISLR